MFAWYLDVCLRTFKSLFVKLKKNEFHVSTVAFLGFIVKNVWGPRQDPGSGQVANPKFQVAATTVSWLR